MSQFKNLDKNWEVTGPEEIEKAGKWKVFWCKHPFTSDVRKAVCIRYPDIAYYQCKDCGAWCNFPDPGYAGRLLKAMLTGDNRHAFKDHK